MSHPTHDTSEETPTKVTVKPARPWPVFEEDHAKAELAALKMLSTGHSERAVAQHFRKHLSYAQIRALAQIVAEEAAHPVQPRNVLRKPRPRRPARVRVVDRTGQAPDPEAQSTAEGRQSTLPLEATPAPAPQPEPEQLSLCL